mgnify:CR=1 FL=1
MRKKFIQYFPFGSFFGLKKLGQNIPLNCIFPLYHGVSDNSIDFINALYKHKTTAQFKQDLAYLQQYFEPVSLKECIDQIALGKPFAKPSFHLTFDDGLCSFYDVVAPILTEKNMSATCFVNSQFMDNKDLMYRYKVGLIIHHITSENKLKSVAYYKNLSHLDVKEIDQTLEKLGIDVDAFLDEERPYLTKAQMIELSAKGFTFGGHSTNHPQYHLITDKEKLYQTIESVDALDFLNQKIKSFAYPFTDANISDSIKSKIAASVDISFGCAGIKPTKIPNHLQRIDFEIATLPASKIVKNDLIYQKLLSCLKNN